MRVFFLLLFCILVSLLFNQNLHSQDVNFELPEWGYDISADGKYLFVADRYENRVRGISFMSKKDITHLRHSEVPIAVFVDDEDSIITTVDANLIKIWDAKTFLQLDSIPILPSFSEVYQVKFNANSNTICLAGFYKMLIVDYKIKKVNEVAFSGSIKNVAFNTAGDKIYITDSNHKLLICNFLAENWSLKDFGKVGGNIGAIASGDNCLYIITYPANTFYKYDKIYRYSAEGKLLDSREISSYSGFTTVKGEVNDFTIDFDLSFQVLKDDYLLIEGLDGILLIKYSGSSREKIIKNQYSKQNRSKGFQLKNQFLILSKDDEIIKLNFNGQLLDRVVLSNYNDSFFCLDSKKTNLLMNGRNTIVTFSEKEGNKQITIVNKPNGIYAVNGNDVIFSTVKNTIEIWNTDCLCRKSEFRLNDNNLPVAMVANGTTLFVATANSNDVVCYDIISGKYKNTISVGDHPITALSSFANTLYVGADNGLLFTYDIITNKILKKDHYFFDGISSISNSQNHQIVAGKGRFSIISSPNDTTLIVAHNDYITSVDMTELNSHGYAVTTSTNDLTSRLWDLKNKVLLQNIGVDSAKNLNFSLFIGDLNIATLSDVSYKLTNNDSLFQTTQGTDVRTIYQPSNSGGETRVKLSPAERYIAMAGTNNVKIWDVISGQLLSTIQIQTDLINDVEILTDERTLVVLTGGGTALQYYDIFTGKLTKNISLKSCGLMLLHELRINPQSNNLIAFNVYGWHEPVLIHGNTGLILNRLPIYDNQIQDIRFSNNGKIIAIYGKDKVNLYEWNDAFLSGSSTPILTMPFKSGDIHHHARKKISFSNDNKYVVAMFFEDGKPETRVYDISSKSQLPSPQRGGVATFGFNTTLIQASLEKEGRLEFIDSDSGELIKTLSSSNPHMQRIEEIVFSNKYNRFISIDKWGNFKFWDGITGALISESNRFDNDVYNILTKENTNKILYNHKKGMFYFDTEDLTTHLIKDANNYPFRVAINDQQEVFYFTNNNEEGNYCLLRNNLLTETIDTLSLHSSGAETSNLKLSSDNDYLAFTETVDETTTLILIHLKNKNTQRIKLTENEGFLKFHPVLANVLLMAKTQRKKVNDKLEFHREIYAYDCLKDKKLSVFFDYNYTLSEEGITTWANETNKAEIISPQAHYITYLKASEFGVVNLMTNQEVFSSYDGYKMASVIFSHDEQKLYILMKSGELTFLDLVTGKIVPLSNIGIAGTMHYLTPNDLLIHGYNDEILIYNLVNSRKTASLFIHDGNEVSIIDRYNNYYSTPGALKKIAFRTLTDVYGFEQFDLYYNKPQSILSALNSPNIKLKEYYEQAWRKRIKLSGVNNIDIHSITIPELRIDKQSLPVNTLSKDFSFEIMFDKEIDNLNTFNVWVNCVPLYGSQGKRVNGISKQKVNMELNSGINKIQVSCINKNGVESLREQFEISYTPEVKVKPDLYLISISVSEYQDSTFNLKYAVKDGEDIIQNFSQSQSFNKIIAKSLFNQSATRDSILLLKKILSLTKVDDHVVLFISGHGLLDDKFGFYFATHDIDFKNPSSKGISYDDLERLLDGIPARHKLFMMDACHSGEVDKEELAVTDTQDSNQGLKSGINAYTYRAALLNKNDDTKVGLSNSFELMQDLFANLNRGSGTVVISAAAGDSYALESDDWQNGVFTFALINGLKSGQADIDKNGVIMVNELRKYIVTQVQELTNGRQKPTIRQGDVEFDFLAW
jgi:hypothetical protein